MRAAANVLGHPPAATYVLPRRRARIAGAAVVAFFAVDIVVNAFLDPAASFFVGLLGAAALGHGMARRPVAAAFPLPAQGAWLPLLIALQPLGYAPRSHDAQSASFAHPGRADVTATLDAVGVNVEGPGDVLARLHRVLDELAPAAQPASVAPDGGATAARHRWMAWGAPLVVFFVASYLAGVAAEEFVDPDAGGPVGALGGLLAASVAFIYVPRRRLALRARLPADAASALRRVLEPAGWTPLARDGNVLAYGPPPGARATHVLVLVHGADATIVGPAGLVARMHRALAALPSVANGAASPAAGR